MPETTEAELAPNVKALWLKALTAAQTKNHGYAIKLIQSVIKDSPGFLDGRKVLRKCAGNVTGGPTKKSKIFGMKTGGGLGTMKLSGQVKKDAAAALPAIEAELEKDPYSPELNPVEKLWDMLRDGLCNRSWKSLDHLLDATTRWLEEFWTQPDRIRSLIGEGWMLNQANA